MEKSYLKGGLEPRYKVEKLNGEPVDPEADYFVMRIDKDPHSWVALLAYAKSVKYENKRLSDELILKSTHYTVKDQLNKLKLNQLCFATYPVNKSLSNETDLFYCIPIAIGDEYSTCLLFFGNEPTKLRFKGLFDDVCTSDLQPL